MKLGKKHGSCTTERVITQEEGNSHGRTVGITRETGKIGGIARGKAGSARAKRKGIKYAEGDEM